MKGQVYCIKEIATGKIIYIGSTTIGISSRKSTHKTDCYKHNKQTQLYQYIRTICPSREDFDKCFEFETMETITVDDRDQLLQLENTYIRNNPGVLNKYRAFISEEELKEYNREYYKSDKMKEYNREYHKSDKRKAYRHTDKWREYKRNYNREYRKRKNSATI